MAQESYERLAPFIRDYVFATGWQGLRPVQEAAIGAILDTPHNLLLSCGTSTGKTEAAFFPILTQIEKSPHDSVDVLYIAPLKALINDQFERLSYLCKTADIPVFRRHGDVSDKNKKAFLASPAGILQTTPESLESFLVVHAADVPRVFAHTRYIVIDELHALLGSDRGSQVLCQIARLSEEAHISPRLVGLSATIGNAEDACRLLSACNGRKTLCPVFEGEKLNVSLLYEWFDDRKTRDAFVYDAVKKKNSLVFANSREETESVTASLREIAAKRRDNGDILIHHGNISASLRHDAEKALKSSSRHAVVCATSTLELGIDIGRLERVVSLGTPNTVSSFLQRLGRSGRRGNTPEMLSVFRDRDGDGDDASRFDLLPFDFLQGVALVELYRRERFVEPPNDKKYPYGLLCHQTLSFLAGHPEGLLPPDLARRMLTLAPFHDVSIPDYKRILSNLCAGGYLEQTGDGKIIPGLSAERLLGHYKFYAVFKEEENYLVKEEGGKEIGKLPEAVPPGVKFSLAGRVWVCERLDADAHVILARPAKGKLSSFWRGSLTCIDDKVAEYTAKILDEDDVYPYLGKNAVRVLSAARDYARMEHLTSVPLHAAGDDTYVILPWFGSRAMNTLCRYIRRVAGGTLVTRVVIENPYVLSLKLDSADVGRFRRALSENLYADNAENLSLLDENESCTLEKYDYLVPKELLRKAYAADRMDIRKVGELIERL